jgi:O-acetylhomoserine (thiol)-lyase
MAGWGFTTRLVHGGVHPEHHGGATTPPIYQTAAFAYPTADELEATFAGRAPGHIYTRISNPTVSAFEERMTLLEGGRGALAAASGMAAITTTILALASQGDEIVASESLFGGTLHLFDGVLSRFGVRTRYVDCTDVEAVRRAVGERTALIYAECLANPKLDVPPLRKLSDLAQERAVPLVVDGTLTTPYLVRAADHGVHVVLHSATKYLTGNGSTIGGVVVDCGTFDWRRCRSQEVQAAVSRAGREMAFLVAARSGILQNTGACMSPFGAYLHCLGLETLSLRMERHCANALALARFLRERNGVTAVGYPGLEDDPRHALAREQFGGRFGALLTLRLSSRESCFRVVRGLRLAKNLANLGDSRTLVIHPASTIYRDCTDPQRTAAGVTEDMLRVSVGIEDPEDIMEDFRAALEGA